MYNILESYSIPDLKKMIRSKGLDGYCKLSKSQLISYMTNSKNLELFSNIKVNQKSIKYKFTDNKIDKLQRQVNQYHKKNRFVITEVKEVNFIKPKIINKDELLNKIKVHKELIHKLKIEEETLMVEFKDEPLPTNFILSFD